jgi:hypothetical protein
MAVSSIKLGNPTRVHQDAVIAAHPGTLVAVQLNGGTTASSLLFHNDIDDAGGTDLYSIVAPCVTATASEAGSVFVLLPDEGIKFDTGCFVALVGTLAIGWVWFR